MMVYVLPAGDNDANYDDKIPKTKRECVENQPNLVNCVRTAMKKTKTMNDVANVKGEAANDVSV